MFVFKRYFEMKFSERIVIISLFVVSVFIFSWMVSVSKLNYMETDRWYLFSKALDQLKHLKGSRRTLNKSFFSSTDVAKTYVGHGLLTLLEVGNNTEFNDTLLNEMLSRPVRIPVDLEILLNSIVCDQWMPYLIILVPSKPGNQRARDAIRQTYAQMSSDLISGVSGQFVGKIVRVVFLLGRGTVRDDLSLKEESKTQGDIVQFDFKDSYVDLTLKVLNGLKWVSNFCSQVSFVVKADEDVFVNTVPLLGILENYGTPPRGAVLGYIYGGGKVWRIGKWATKEEDYPKPWFPSYASGTAYVLTRNLIEDVVNIAERRNRIPIEDVYITGIIASETLGASLVHIPGASQKNDNKTAPCDIVSCRKVFTTNLKPTDFYPIWKALTMFNIACL